MECVAIALPKSWFIVHVSFNVPVAAASQPARVCARIE
jgi:hypothetical protein